MPDHWEPENPQLRDADSPVYPDIEVRVRSLHPLVLVSSVRYALWRAGVASEQISRFSREALTARSEDRQRQICAHWVSVHS